MSRGWDLGPTFDGPLPQVQLDAWFQGQFHKGRLINEIESNTTERLGKFALAKNDHCDETDGHLRQLSLVIQLCLSPSKMLFVNVMLFVSETVCTKEAKIFHRANCITYKDGEDTYCPRLVVRTLLDYVYCIEGPNGWHLNQTKNIVETKQWWCYCPRVCQLDSFYF